MKVTVKDYLNVRIGQPGLNAPCYQYLAPGTELEIDGTVTRGDAYDGIDTWLKDAAGNHYWSGGLHIPESLMLVPVKKTVANYNQLINLPEEIKNNGGANVVIGIVDTGCWKDKALTANLAGGYSALDHSPDFDDVTTKSHGTFIAGIIAGEDSFISEVTGVAPLSKLLPAKSTIYNGIDDVNLVYDSLNWLINVSELTPDLINCSFDIEVGDQAEKFTRLFDAARKKDILLIAAGQDNAGLLKTIYYPAAHPAFIAVGCISKEEVGDLSRIDKKINYLVPDIEFYSTTKYNLYDRKRGSSFSSALVTGALALVISDLKKKGIPKNRAIEFIDQSIYPQLNAGNYRPEPVIYKNT